MYGTCVSALVREKWEVIVVGSSWVLREKIPKYNSVKRFVRNVKSIPIHDQKFSHYTKRK